MKLYYDFHIHSGLSPCSSEDMSPNNIVNMSLIKGLDAIAVTDHNGIKNVRICHEVGQALGLIVVPGMEIQTIEDVHSIALFKSIEALENFYREIEHKRLLIKNKPDKFGYQCVYNAADEIISYEENYLITPFNITLDHMIELARKYEGLVFPAHINRNSFSIIKSLGFIAKELDIKNIEWYGKRPEDVESYSKRMFKTYRELINSDAHDLINISEKENYIEVQEMSIEGIFNTLDSDV